MSVIIFFSPHDLPSAHISRNFDYAKRLAKKGHAVKVIGNNFSHREKKRIEPKGLSFYASTNIEKVEVIWLNTTEYSGNGFFRAINALSYLYLAIRYVFSKVEVLDIAIGDSVPPTAGLAAYLTSKLKNSKFIFQVRDVWPIALVFDKAIQKYSAIFFVLRVAEIVLYRGADKIYSTVPMLKSHIKESWGDIRKVVYMPNGADLSLIEYKKREFDNTQPFRIVYAGGFGNAHDAESIIKAAKILSSLTINFVFDFYGDGVKLEKCKKLAESLSLHEVYFHKSIDKSLLSPKLSDADLLIAAVTNSDAYKFGINLNKIYDYLAAGRPIVLAVKSSHRPIEEANCGFIVKPEHPEEIADSILKIYLMSQKDRDIMGLNARLYAEAHYDIDRLSLDFESNLP